MTPLTEQLRFLLEWTPFVEALDVQTAYTVKILSIVKWKENCLLSSSVLMARNFETCDRLKRQLAPMSGTLRNIVSNCCVFYMTSFFISHTMRKPSFLDMQSDKASTIPCIRAFSKPTQRAPSIDGTSYQRQCNVMTLHWDADTTLHKRHVPLLQDLYPSCSKRIFWSNCADAGHIKPYDMFSCDAAQMFDNHPISGEKFHMNSEKAT